jgi:beta-galactosidase
MFVSFPKDFLWGTATSAYQIEGASRANGKGASIWDGFCQIPGKVLNGDHGEVACDHYHRYKEDVQLMKNMGVKAYRFSISWPRVLPNGRAASFNAVGMKFYSDLIDELLKNDIQPWVTLYHWDLPLALQMECDGWLGDDISDLFADYARVCFEHLGDRVKNWITINEAWVVAILGYGQGVFAPGRISNREPYQAGQNLLLAHAKAVKVYRDQFQAKQSGSIGITNNCDWREPLTDTAKDKTAATRALEFFIGWFADPIYLGDYPASMKQRLGERLPTITAEQRKLIQGSSDFFGLNHYTTMFTAESGGESKARSVYGNGGLSEDQDVDISTDPNWPLTSMGWAIVPWGCKKLLEWLAARYGNPPIYITENGCSFNDELIDGAVNDQQRVEFFRGYLKACGDAISNGVNLKGYFIWSFMDNFEWASGYSKRFGIHYVDYQTLARTPKASAKWYARVIASNAVE